MDSDAYPLSEHESFFWKRPSPSSGPSKFLFEAIDIDSDAGCEVENSTSNFFDAEAVPCVARRADLVVKSLGN